MPDNVFQDQSQAVLEELVDKAAYLLRTLQESPNETTAANLQAVLHDIQAQPSLAQASQEIRDEVEDLITNAAQAIQPTGETRMVPVQPVTQNGEITGIEQSTALTAIRDALWPQDKPLWAKPGFILGVAIGGGVLYSWQKENIADLYSKLMKDE